MGSLQGGLSPSPSSRSHTYRQVVWYGVHVSVSTTQVAGQCQRCGTQHGCTAIPGHFSDTDNYVYVYSSIVSTGPRTQMFVVVCRTGGLSPGCCWEMAHRVASERVDENTSVSVSLDGGDDTDLLAGESLVCQQQPQEMARCSSVFCARCHQV